jgi:hypothetical protein
LVKYGVSVLKKIWLFLIIFSISLLGSKIEVEKQIYKQILYGIFPYKETIYVWYDENMEFLKTISKVHIVQDINSADILILAHPIKEEKIDNKVVFVQSYHLLKQYSSFAIGGFYWQKGRPNLLFLKENLEKFNIRLDKTLERYIEDEL